MLKVKVENPAALHFILQDDIYLLNQDKSLYITGLKPAPDIKTDEVNFNYLGLNKKNFLIVVHYPGHEFIADVHLTALESILKRKELSLDDVAIMNAAKHSNTGLNQLNTYFKPRTLLILGQNAAPAQLDMPALNSPVTFGGLQVLYTYSFEEMMTSNENKKAFWEKVKTL